MGAGQAGGLLPAEEHLLWERLCVPQLAPGSAELTGGSFSEQLLLRSVQASSPQASPP